MQEIVRIFVGILVLILGFPIGTYLAKKTKEELKEGQKWFRVIIFLSMILGFVMLVLRNDALMFGFFFIALVTSRSIVKN